MSEQEKNAPCSLSNEEFAYLLILNLIVELNIYPFSLFDKKKKEKESISPPLFSYKHEKHLTSVMGNFRKVGSTSCGLHCTLPQEHDKATQCQSLLQERSTLNKCSLLINKR
jgi:hypothetical protein